ncbi:uncharacterized protein LOC112494309 [Cephus cinctus]|uniref:Uncharacterized protein LOC112494309 n=1 Tax=Cephus cinctus TaxID=211228 RepID=A0AAJ7W101_CEPCN|nr:uncharacterized protein LOC112494309 [Cephus cinctus]
MDLFINIDIFNSDDDYEDYKFLERRQYTIQSKPNNFQMWDDIEFIQRYRLKKTTVLELLHRIQEQLLIQNIHNSPRSNVIIMKLKMKLHNSQEIKSILKQYNVCYNRLKF